MNTKSWGVGLVALTLIGGCALEPEGKPDFDDTKGYDSLDGKSEAWGPSDSPSGFNANLEYKIASLPLEGQAQNIPWAANYWPVAEDSINHKWAGASSTSAPAKYGQAFGVTGVEDAVSKYHGVDAQTSRKACTQDSECTELKDGSMCAKRVGQTSGRCIPTWWGICHAWAPAAILVPEPKHDVTYNGVTFKVQDIKALVELAHNSTNTKFVSLRCDTDAPDINFDNYGRPTAGDAECKDTNPGTYHVLLTNYLGIQKAAFVEDRTYDDEVWNQPLRGYKIKSQTEVTATQANALIGVTAVGGTTVNKSGTVAKSAWAHQGSFAVTAGQIVKVQMKGTGDADLHVKFGAQPTATSYDCRPYADGSNELCELTAPAGATSVFVSVNGYATTSDYQLAITIGGTVPVDYQFNANAKKFYHVKSDVYYITESSASTDGNLGSVIDTYTRTDSYEYILEVDAAGKIIGGEWIGASKTNHPDFVWLPISVQGSSVAGGKITYANVKMLLDLSIAPVGGGGGGGGGTDVTVNESGTVAKNVFKTYGPYNVAAGATLTATMSGDGDADLYVRKGAAPTTTSYDCRPYKSGSAESCAVVGAAQVYVSVRGYATTSNFALTITYKDGAGGGGGGGNPPPATVTHLNETGSVALGEMKMFTMAVPAGQKIVVKTTSAADIDVYVMMDGAPTTESYTARGYTSSGNETVTITPSSSGTLHIGVHGYAAGAFTLKTSSN